MKLDKRTVMVILLGVLVAFSSWWFFARPAAQKLDEAATQRAAIEQEIGMLAQQKQAIAEGRNPLEMYTRGLTYAERLLPQAEAVRETRLASELSQSAAQRGMKDTSIDVQTPAEGGSEGLMVVPVTVSATGSYDNVLGWIDDLREDAGLRSVEGLTLAAAEGGNYQVSFTLKVWYSSAPPLVIPGASSSESSSGSSAQTPATSPSSATSPTQPLPVPTPGG